MNVIKKLAALVLVVLVGCAPVGDAPVDNGPVAKTAKTSALVFTVQDAIDLTRDESATMASVTWVDIMDDAYMFELADIICQGYDNNWTKEQAYTGAIEIFASNDPTWSTDDGLLMAYYVGGLFDLVCPNG